MGGTVDERLMELRGNISYMRQCFEGIVSTCQEAEAHGVEFAGQMLVESLGSFEVALVDYIERKSDASEKGL
jgi:prenyltransferase beta subunit